MKNKKWTGLILALVLSVLVLPLAGTLKTVEATDSNYLTFTAEEANSTVTFNWKSGSDVKYSFDGGANWNDYTQGDTIVLDTTDTTVEAKKIKTTSKKVSFKGQNVKTGHTGTAEKNECTDQCKHFTITSDTITSGTITSGKIAASGSVTSLTDGNGGNENVSLTDSCYNGMFSNCTALTTVSEELLPAKTLSKKCYQNMFSGCTGLTTIPEKLLPATNLADFCYECMFWRSGLTTVPEKLLPATTLKPSCYSSMFRGTGLTTVPEKLLQATNLADGCYSSMFQSCEKLTTAPKLPAETLQSQCYVNMFQYCSSLLRPADLSHVTTLEGADDYFGGLIYQNCKQMYDGCSNLKIYTTPRDDCQTEWIATNAVNGSVDWAYAMFSMTITDVGEYFPDEHRYTGKPTAKVTYYILNEPKPEIKVEDPNIKVEVDQSAIQDIQDQYAKKTEYAGKDVKVVFTIKESQNPKDQAMITNAAAGKKVQFIDALLTLFVTDSSGEVKDWNIGDNNDILIRSIYQFDFTGKKDVQIFRVHNDKLEELKESPNDDGEYVAFDREAGTVTIAAKKYSTFAVAYNEATKAVNTGLTGSNSTLYIAVGLLVLAAAAITVLVVRKKSLKEMTK